MKALKKFLTMFCTAGVLLFIGFDRCELPPKTLIGLTGAACGVVNMLYYWFDKD